MNKNRITIAKKQNCFILIGLLLLIGFLLSSLQCQLNFHTAAKGSKIKNVDNKISIHDVPMRHNEESKVFGSDIPMNYAVFSSNTPNGDSYRGYDYAYNLPLTALAWERIGFRSIVLIIGSRCEWENNPALNLILSSLKDRLATVIFVSAPQEYRTTLSQTARLFAVNLMEFHGRVHDYLITSDSDLWPLRREHYLPQPNSDIVLLHSECCGFFMMNNVSYRMYPMSNIGATASTWLQIMNDNHIIANDSESIMNYLEDAFGKQAKGSVVVGEDAWYMDQRLVSIRLQEWMIKHGNSSVHRVSDNGFSRLDRIAWDADQLGPEHFKLRYDTHLPHKGFLPIQWKRIQPLINLMYGRNSMEAIWCKNYSEKFLQKVINYVHFVDIDY